MLSVLFVYQSWKFLSLDILLLIALLFPSVLLCIIYCKILYFLCCIWWLQYFTSCDGNFIFRFLICIDFFCLFYVKFSLHTIRSFHDIFDTVEVSKSNLISISLLVIVEHIIHLIRKVENI